MQGGQTGTGRDVRSVRAGPRTCRWQGLGRCHPVEEAGFQGSGRGRGQRKSRRVVKEAGPAKEIAEAVQRVGSRRRAGPAGVATERRGTFDEAQRRWGPAEEAGQGIGETGGRGGAPTKAVLSGLANHPYSITSHRYSMPGACSRLTSVQLPGLAQSGSLQSGNSWHFGKKGSLGCRKKSWSEPRALREKPPESRLHRTNEAGFLRQRGHSLPN